MRTWSISNTWCKIGHLKVVLGHEKVDFRDQIFFVVADDFPFTMLKGHTKHEN